jgi:UDP-N-acetylmuramate dehydrogenase
MEEKLLKNHTWFKTGGIANSIVKIKDIEELKTIIKNHYINKKKYFVLGAGSNVLMDDKGFNGTIIKTQLLRKIKLIDKDIIEAESGVIDLNLANFASQNNIEGLEFLSTIPGTIGGAIVMNAGCLGKEVKDILISCKCINEKGEEVIFNRHEINFQYRNSYIPSNYVVVSGIFKGTFIEGSSQKLKNSINEMFQIKEKNQPIGIASVGSVFKNPLPLHAWEVVNKSNFRGYKYKSVMVSEKHTNFIVHNPDYNEEIQTKHFVELTNIITQKVLKEQNIQLELEVKIVPFE